jgi:prepilin-type N-terminal cleavage/methylation domain-containing protein
MNRSGFTLIELIIVVVIIGIMSVVGINTFDSTRARIVFFNDVSRIDDSLKLARSIAVSDKSVGTIIIDEEEESVNSSENGIVAFFEYNNEKFENLKIYPVVNVNDVYHEDQEIIAEVDFSDNQQLTINEVQLFAVNDSTEINAVVREDFYITFAIEGSCNFLSGSDLEINSIDTENVFFNMPLILNQREEPIRYLYMHRVACMPEVLLNDFLTLNENA